MRIAPVFLLGLALAVAADAQVRSYDDWLAYRERERQMDDILRRAVKSYPRRRDTPLRALNISDNEVRAVEAAVLDYLPKRMVNISPVVEGCPCEEGRDCVDQVYVTASNGSTTDGVMVSNFKGDWRISVMQKWWVDYTAMIKRTQGKSDWETHEERWKMMSSYPVCEKPKDKPPVAAVLPAPTN